MKGKEKTQEEEKGLEEKAMCSEGSRGGQRSHVAGDREELSLQGEEEAGRKGMWWRKVGQSMSQWEREDPCMGRWGAQGAPGGGHGGF